MKFPVQLPTSAPCKDANLDEIRIRERSAATYEYASAQAAAITSQIEKEAFKAQNFAMVAQREKGARKIVWLRRLAGVLESAVGNRAACATGCSHCCNILVLITAPEARQIARETGASFMEPKTYGVRHNDQYIGTPCPFLQDNRCSIYESRPYACRVHYNLDRDGLLCTLVKGETIRVPYLDTTMWHAAYLHAVSPKMEDTADIREFFPHGGSRS